MRTLKRLRVSMTKARRGSALSIGDASSGTAVIGKAPFARANPTMPPINFGASGASILQNERQNVS